MPTKHWSFQRPERGLDHRGRPYRLRAGTWWRIDEDAMMSRRAGVWIALSVLYGGSVALLPFVPGGLWIVLALISPVGLLLVFGVVPLLYRFASRAVPPAGIRLAYHRCGSCNYDLAGLEPEPDGCRVCPECGAAWRLWPRCRTCGGTLTDEPLATRGWYECTACGECWRESASLRVQGAAGEAESPDTSAAFRSGDHSNQSSSASDRSAKC